MPNTLLEIENLQLQAGTSVLLHGFHCHIDAGECVAVVGPSGCGKSTLLRALARLDEPSAGEIRLHLDKNHDQANVLYMPCFRRAVMYVHQRPILRSDTVRNNLAYPHRFQAQAEQRFDEARAITLLDRLGVGSQSVDQDARSLSIGQQQRVCLIRAALLDPTILLLDEPTSALDPDAAHLVEEWIQTDLIAGGRAVLVVSHDPQQIERLQARVIDLTAPTRAYMESRTSAKPLVTV